jgi:hypothetical protein
MKISSRSHKGFITREEFMAKLSLERGAYQNLMKRIEKGATALKMNSQDTTYFDRLKISWLLFWRGTLVGIAFAFVWGCLVGLASETLGANGSSLELTKSIPSRRSTGSTAETKTSDNYSTSNLTS